MQICDCIGDADTDLMRCIRLHISDPNKMSGRLFIDDLMAEAGYVAGVIKLLKKGYPVRNIAKIENVGISTVMRLKREFIKDGQ